MTNLPHALRMSTYQERNAHHLQLSLILHSGASTKCSLLRELGRRDLVRTNIHDRLPLLPVPAAKRKAGSSHSVPPHQLGCNGPGHVAGRSPATDERTGTAQRCHLHRVRLIFRWGSVRTVRRGSGLSSVSRRGTRLLLFRVATLHRSLPTAMLFFETRKRHQGFQGGLIGLFNDSEGLIELLRSFLYLLFQIAPMLIVLPYQSHLLDGTLGRDMELVQVNWLR